MVKVYKDGDGFIMDDNGSVVRCGTIFSHGKYYVKLPNNSANRGYICVEKVGENGVELEAKMGGSISVNKNNNYLDDILSYASDEDRKLVEDILAKCKKQKEIAMLQKLIEDTKAQIEELCK